ncbi:MAG: hypothetical protein ACOX9C_12425 [Kiritimatiellia bacterium]|jgi:hypothetical protein
MKTRTQAYFSKVVAAILAVVSGLAFANNVVVVARWWQIFKAVGGDATTMPVVIPGIIPWLDWTAVDYSCVTTFIPFLGFFLIARSLELALRGHRQDPEQFPFYKGYDQFNIALGLVGTLWGIIVIGYFQLDTVTMEELMKCLHTALYSTTMAVIWVFGIDHALLRPRLLRLLRGLQGTEDEDETLVDLIDGLSSAASGLCTAWEGNREKLGALNDAVSLATAEFRALGGIGQQVGAILVQDLTSAANQFIAKLSVAGDALETRQNRLDAAFEERQRRLDAALGQHAAALQAFGEVLAAVQQTQAGFATAAEKLAADHADLRTALTAERNAGDALRSQVASLQGENEGRQKRIEELMAHMREADAAFAKRLDSLRAERDALAGERATLEAEKAAALRDLDASRDQASRAEALLEKIKSAFNA